MELTKQALPWWRQSWSEDPLKIIMLLALIVRVLAAIFSKGYAFHDDHFESLNVAQDWVDGVGHWINGPKPPLHSMVYAGFNAVLLYLAEILGIMDPQYKMIWVRLVHGMLSLLTVYYGFKITRYLSTVQDATIVGALLALLWFMPYLAVKNLNEMVCVPFIIMGTYFIIRYPNQPFNKWWMAGFLFGLAFTIRYQSVLFAGGLGLGMLLQGKWKGAVTFTFGFIVSLLLFQGVMDYLFFDYPLESIVTYFLYNQENAYNYLTLPFYTYIGTVLGFLVPPVSVFLAIGFARSYKYHLGLFIGVVVFFVIHSIFPNKQERFMLPFFPLFIILAVMGWNALMAKSSWWQKRVGFVKGSWKFFWVLNLLVMFILVLTYSKKDRIEPVYFLSDKEDVVAVVVETQGDMSKIPVFYIGKKASDYGDLYNEVTGHVAFLESDSVFEEIPVFYEFPATKKDVQLLTEINKTGKHPNYVILKGESDLEARIEKMRQILGGSSIEKQTTISPSFYDLILHTLNPTIHAKETATVIKINY